MDAHKLAEIVTDAADQMSVGPPPVVAIERASASRRRVRAMAVGCAGLAATGVIAAAQLTDWGAGQKTTAGDPSSSESPSTGKGADGEWTRKRLEEYLTELPGVPVVLPAELPEGFAWEGPISYSAGEGGEVTSRTSLFALREAASDGRFRLCAEEGQSACPSGAGRITREVDGLRVVITVAGDGPGRDEIENFLRNVPLVTDGTVGWLR